MIDKPAGSQNIGDFQIVRELGRGGMGVVYEAQQKSLKRRVALKVLSSGLGLTTKAIMRFKREAEAAAKLHHTNIVPIYTTGEENRVPYYAMELIDGPSLDQVIHFLRKKEPHNSSEDSFSSTSDSASSSGGQLPKWVVETTGFGAVTSNHQAMDSSVGDSSTSSFGTGTGYFDNIARMLADVADALAHAHDLGVIHRDIKPSNLLLAPDGHLSLNDFGLARMLEQPGMTISGEFMGSPMYMSPEQVTAGRIPLDHRTDIYSLGATLYELLTLRHPYDGKHRDQVLSQIIHKEPTRPRWVNKRIPQDLETICVKALEKDPDRRYQTAEHFADDLRRFVDRHAISARRVSILERGLRWARKNKALTAMTCALLVVGFISAALLFNAQQRERTLLREQAKNDALTAAMSGDLPQAMIEIEKARSYGADATWELLLTSQVALAKGRPDDALRHLEAAVLEQNNSSVMAHSMLAEAYVENLMEDRYEDMMQELEKLPARTAEDYMFKGQAIRFSTPHEALALTEQAVRMQPSFGLARVVRARVRVHVGLETNNREEVLDALNELNYVEKDLMQEGPMLSYSRLFCMLSAYHLTRREADVAKRFLEMADGDVNELRNFPEFHLGSSLALFYYHFLTESDSSKVHKMDALMQEVIETGKSGFVVEPYATACFRDGGDRIAVGLQHISRLAKQDEPYAAYARTILQSESEAGRQSAKRLWQEYVQNQPPMRDGSDVQLLLLLGQKAEAINRARERLRTYVPNKYGLNPEAVFKFFSGETTREELIRSAGKSERLRSNANFALGLMNLVDGRRADALNDFQAAAESSVFYATSSGWSRAFVARMKRDSNWPEWLPNKD